MRFAGVSKGGGAVAAAAMIPFVLEKRQTVCLAFTRSNAAEPSWGLRGAAATFTVAHGGVDISKVKKRPGTLTGRIE